jgi:aspartyl-tRNA(Asn)/glutamyl-tRNA(Gln) amidotransferase subunit A
VTAALPAGIADAARGLRAGDCTAVELTECALAQIEARNDELGGFVTVATATARAAAAAADRERADGVDRGPLHGIPIGIKDVISTCDAPTRANSLVTGDGWGDGQDAEVVRRLRAAGCVVVGKTTTNEFACRIAQPGRGFPAPRNPLDQQRTASGSSSGSAIAVAAGQVLATVGTDTGGSIRAPAAAVGITGLKVTYGLVPTLGVIPLGPSMDTVGPMARSAMDCALLLEAMAGPGSTHSQALTGDVTGVRIGMSSAYFFDRPEIDPGYRAAVLAAVALLEHAGAVVVPVELPLAEAAREASTMTWMCEALAYHRNALIERWDDYGAPTKMLLAEAAFFSAADYVRAQRIGAAFRRELAAAFEAIDVLVTPTTLKVAERFAEIDGPAHRFGPNYMAPWNIAGTPAVAVPCGRDDAGMPYSMQVVGRPFAEATALRVADAYQRRTDHHQPS